jgi:hypothetical protein
MAALDLLMVSDNDIKGLNFAGFFIVAMLVLGEEQFTTWIESG